MNGLPSGSRWQRLRHCIGEAVLQNIDEFNPWAGTGVSLHSFLEDCSNLGRDKALEKVPADLRRRCEAIEVEKLPVGGTWRAELAIAYDIAKDSARLLGQGLNRNYGKLAETEIPITLDAANFDKEKQRGLLRGCEVRSRRSSSGRFCAAGNRYPCTGPRNEGDAGEGRARPH